MVKTRKLLIPLTATTLALFAALIAVDSVRAHTRITTDITWSEDIRSIFRKKCMACHHPGSEAPDYVDLTVYGTETQPGARAWAVSIEEMVLTDQMPPWRADSRFGTFSNSRTLSQEEIDYIVAWVQGGAPQGPYRNLPVPPEFVDRTWNFGNPDMEFVLPEEHVIPEGKSYDSVTVTFPVELDEDAWITGYEFFPGSPKNVYRMRAYLHDPEGAEPLTIEVEVQTEYDPFADEDALEETRQRVTPPGPYFIGKWMRGEKPRLFPDAAGRKLRAGSTLELQIEYRRPLFADPSLEVKDLSRFGLFLAEEGEEIDLLVESKAVASEPFVVKAGSADLEVRTTLTFDENVHLIGLNPDLGMLGKSLHVRATYPDGLSRTLLWIPEFKYWFNMSYDFAAPIEAPAGTTLEIVAHYDNTLDNWDNPNDPPIDVASGDGMNDERLALVVEYMLDDHLQLPIVFEPVTAEEQEKRGGMAVIAGGIFGDEPLPSLGDEGLPAIDKGFGQLVTGQPVFWCPMRGSPCELHDYHAPGNCDDCGMNLLTKEDWIEIKTSGNKKLAAANTDWELSGEGRSLEYWCPNRENADHELVAYPSPGPCPVCSEMLAHRSRFDFVRTYACITDTCSRYKDVFYSEGLCPECGQPVQAMGHMDHTPLHGGEQFFMASNLYHHLEGAMPEEGQFRLYFYDDYKRPLDGRNFTGRAVFETIDDDSGEITEETYTLKTEEGGDAFLIAEIPSALPAEFYVLVNLAGEENRFDFYFEELTVEPEEVIAPTDIRLHTHERIPVVVPELAVDVVREILRRSSLLRALIDQRNWYALHTPAFDAKDFVEALSFKQENLGPRQRGVLKQATTAINLGADALDRAGDASDPPRVQRAFAKFSEGIEMLKGLFPSALAQ